MGRPSSAGLVHSKNDSATALSWQLPVRPQEGRASLARVHSASVPPVHCAPLSLRETAFPATWPRGFADSSAATAMSAVMRSGGDRPTAMRAHGSMASARRSQPPPVRRRAMPPASLQAGAGPVKSRRAGSGPGVWARGRGPLPGIGRTAAYPQLPHRLQRPAARKAAETRRHRMREAEAEPSVGFRPRAHRGAPSADRPSSPRPPASHAWRPGAPAPGTRAIIFTGIRSSPPAWADSAQLPLPAEKAAALFGNALPVSSPHTRLRAPRGLRSSTFRSGWPESPASALSPIG